MGDDVDDEVDGLSDYLQFLGVKHYTYVLPASPVSAFVQSVPSSPLHRRLFPAGGLVSSRSVVRNSVTTGIDIGDLLSCDGDDDEDAAGSDAATTVRVDIACSASVGSKCRLAQADMTGVVVWPIALTFAKFASRYAQVFSGRRLMELGCGVGVNGVHIARVTAASTIVITDNNEFAMALARYNLRCNGLIDRIQLDALDWNDSALIASRYADGFDVVYGSDLFYQIEAIDILMPTVHALLAKQTSTFTPLFILAYQHRFTLVTRRLLAAVAQCGFTIAIAVEQQQHSHIINGVHCKLVANENDIPTVSSCILLITRTRYDRTKKSSSSNDSCRFYVAHKRRFCAKRPLQESRLCGHHHSVATERSSACPHCTTLIADVRMSSHMAVCPAAEQERFQQSRSFYSRNINCRGPHELVDAHSGSDVHVSSSFTGADLMSIIDKVKLILQNDAVTIPQCNLQERSHTVDLNPCLYRKHDRQRHRLQCEKMVDVMEQHRMFDDRDGVVAVEMGGGKGVLSEILAQRFVSANNNTATAAETHTAGSDASLRGDAFNANIRGLFLIDRSTFRQKRDVLIRRNNIRFERIRLDISDIRLSHVRSESSSAENANTSVIVMAKHACGSATDMSIHAALHAVNDGAYVRGIALSTCCHHRCEWNKYCNQSFFISNQIDHNMFAIICRLSSWASLSEPNAARSRQMKCRGEQTRIAHSSEEHEDAVTPDADDWFQSVLSASAASLSTLTLVERISIGRSCKRLIDRGRTLRLSSAAWKAELIEFVPQSVTRENMMIVASQSSVALNVGQS